MIKVGYKSIIKLVDHETGQKNLYSLTKDTPRGVYISPESPVGSSLLGKTRGDVIEVSTPIGVRKLEVLSVS